MRLCLPHKKVFFCSNICFIVNSFSAPFHTRNHGVYCIQFVHITPLAFMVDIYFFIEPVCAMFFAHTNCMLIILCKRLEENWWGYQDKADVNWIIFSFSKLIYASTLNYTDIATEKLFFLTSSFFVVWYPVKGFPNVMSNWVFFVFV